MKLRERSFGLGKLLFKFKHRDIPALIVKFMNQARNKGDHQHDQKLVANDVLSLMNSPDMENKPKVIGVNVSRKSNMSIGFQNMVDLYHVKALFQTILIKLF